MQLKIAVAFVAIWAFSLAAVAKAKEEEKYLEDHADSQSKTFNRFGDLTFDSSDYSTDTTQFNRYGDHSTVNYEVAPVPRSSFGVAVDPRGILAPHAEILRFIEAFVKLTAEVVARFHALITENWEPIKTLVNFIFSKIQKLNIILLKGIGVVRNIIEFAFKLFSDWSFTLPSFTLGSFTSVPSQSYDTYGVSANIVNFLEAMKTL